MRFERVFPLLIMLVASILCTPVPLVAAGEGSVGGYVRSATTGAPIRKAIVTLSSPTESLTAECDSEGHFLFGGLPPGRWRLSASRAGFLDRSARGRIIVAPDQHVTDAEVRLPPQGVISGRILDEDGEPVPRARVTIYTQIYQDGRRQWERRNMSAIASDAGEYRFSDLGRGRYLVRAEGSQPATWNPYTDRGKVVMVPAPAWYPSAQTEQNATPLDIVAGADLRGIDVRLVRVARAPAVHVRGHVIAVPGTAAKGISVALIPVDPDVATAGSTAVARPPEFAFDMEVPPGEYRVLANMYSSSDPPAWGRGHVLVSGEVSDLAVPIHAPPDVTGRIRFREADKTSVNLSKVRMALRPLTAFSNDLPQFRSDSTGKLTLTQPLAPGRYALLIDIETVPEGYFVAGIRFGDQEIAPPEEFEITASSVLEVVLGWNAGMITGTVVDAAGESVPDASVTLIPGDGRSRPRVQRVSDDGSFRFGALAPGNYRVYAWDRVQEIQWQDPEIHERYDSSAIKVTIAPGESRSVKPGTIFADEPATR